MKSKAALFSLAAVLLLASCSKNKSRHSRKAGASPVSETVRAITMYEQAKTRRQFGRALKLLEKSCKKNSARACYLAGKIIKNRLSASKDDSKAYRFMDKACSLGEKRGCIAKADLMVTGRGTAKNPAQAVSIYGKYCDSGVSLACNNLGFLYLSGMGVEKNQEKGIALLKKACDAGDPDGCMNLGIAYQTGMGVKQNPDMAMKLLTKACDKGRGGACRRAAMMLELGQEVPPDPEKALEMYKKGCDANDGRACTGYATMLLKSRKRSEAPKALKLMEKACSLGSREGCFSLGAIYQSGLPSMVDKDLEKAALYYSKACHAGQPAACNNLGRMYLEVMPKKDPKQAAHYLELACLKGASLGCAKLGDLLVQGYGVDKNLPKALDMYGRACRAGHKPSCLSMGKMYMNRSSSLYAPQKAIKALDPLCSDGNADACHQIYLLYRTGEKDLPKDEHRAAKYRELACRYGYSADCPEAATKDKAKDKH